MFYTFDTDIAKEYGVNEAVMIANFQHWISKNKANNKNYIDGHYWTYNTNKAFLELFPFWSEQNIKTILNHLKDKGVIITANHNQSTYDRTLWYAFADENKFLSKDQLIQKLELTNGKVRTNQPIPDNIPDNIIKKENKNNKLFLSKKKYGEFNNVLLSNEEMLKLIKLYKWKLTDGIEKLSSYLEYKGDKYKSHYAVLNQHQWVFKEVSQDQNSGFKPKDIQIIKDSTVAGGLRDETPLEYYTRKLGLETE